MPIVIDGQSYYRSAEACRIIGISKSTLLRWLRDGLVSYPIRRDRRGWRLFTEEEVNAFKAEAHRITKGDQFKLQKASLSSQSFQDEISETAGILRH
jgi:excisionase family DNA binding protein